MKKIDWNKGFVGVDGLWRSREDIVGWYVNHVNAGVIERLKKQQKALNNLPTRNDLQEYYLKILAEIELNIDNILKAEPFDLNVMAKKWNDEKEAKKSYHTSKSVFCVPVTKRTPKRTIAENLAYVFDYDKLESKIRGRLGAMLNIKACPYCNQQYTLNIETFDGAQIKEISKYQFDHFFAQSEFPFLALSIYNLVPSCAVCNHSKTAKSLSIDFHPYYGDLDSKAHFELENPIPLLEAVKRGSLRSQRPDIINVKLVPDPDINREDFDKFESQLAISARYQRHVDVIEEIAARSYLKNYYSHAGNFSYISKLNMRLLQRIQHGNYPDRESINKRPLSKLQIDITDQFDKLEK